MCCFTVVDTTGARRQHSPSRTNGNHNEKDDHGYLCRESHMHFNTNPADSHKPSPSALGPLAVDSYGEEMLFSENLGTCADFSELLNKKIRTLIFVQENQKSFFFF